MVDDVPSISWNLLVDEEENTTELYRLLIVLLVNFLLALLVSFGVLVGLFPFAVGIVRIISFNRIHGWAYAEVLVPILPPWGPRGRVAAAYDVSCPTITSLTLICEKVS